MKARVRTAGAAAQTLIIQLDDVGETRKRTSHIEVAALHMPEMAGILHNDLTLVMAGRPKPVGVVGNPTVNVVHPGPEGH